MDRTRGDILWTNPANWDAGAPASGSTAQFNGGGNGVNTIGLGGAAQPINTLLFAGSSTASYNLGVTPGDTFSFDAGGAITRDDKVKTPQTISAALQTNGDLTITDEAMFYGGVGGFPPGLTLNAPITMNAGGTLTVVTYSQDMTTIVNGTITDTPGHPGALVLTGPSNNDILLNGNNTFTGGTTLDQRPGGFGTVQIGSDTAFGSGRLTSTTVTDSLGVPSIEAVGGARSLANAIELNAGFTFVGTNSITLTGPMTVTVSGSNSAASSTIATNFHAASGAASLTLGSATNPSVITLGNPADGAGRTLILSSGDTITVNDVIQDAAPGGGRAAGNLTISANGTLILNRPNTYSGVTTLSGSGTVLPIQFSSAGPTGGAATSGPFGIGTIVFNNTINQHLRPVGDQTLANPITMISGLAMDNAPSNQSNLTLTGPMTVANGGKFISNGFAWGAANSGRALILGSASAPSTLTLPSVLSAPRR